MFAVALVGMTLPSAKYCYLTVQFSLSQALKHAHKHVQTLVGTNSLDHLKLQKNILYEGLLRLEHHNSI